MRIPINPAHPLNAAPISKHRQSTVLSAPSGPRVAAHPMYSIRVNQLQRQAASYASVAAGLAGAGGGEGGAGGSGQPSPSGSHAATPGDRTPTGGEVETDHIIFSAGNPRVEHMVGARFHTENAWGCVSQCGFVAKV